MARFHAFSHILRILAIPFLLLTATLATQGVASASSTSTKNPNHFVVVYKDITSSGHCMGTEGEKDRAGHLISQKKYSCPAETLMEGSVVPLAQALANHKPYQTISNGVIPAYVPSTRVKPLTTQCGDFNYWYGSWTWEGTNALSYVSIDRYNNCNMMIDESSISITSLSKELYRNRDQYASWTGNYGCVGMTVEYPYAYSSFPDIIKNAGYWYEQFVYDGSNCSWFDNWLQIDVAILS